MGSAQKLEEELRSRLAELQREVEADRKERLPENEIEQRIDTFENHWDARFVQERESAIQALKTCLQEAALEQEKVSREAASRQDAKAYEPFDVETRQKMWDATNRSSEPRSLHEQADRERMQAIFDAGAKRIEQRLDLLQDGLRAATDAIRSGQTQNLQAVLDAQMQREQLRAEDQQRQEIELKLRMGPAF